MTELLKTKEQKDLKLLALQRRYNVWIAIAQVPYVMVLLTVAILHHED